MKNDLIHAVDVALSKNDWGKAKRLARKMPAAQRKATLEMIELRRKFQNKGALETVRIGYNLFNLPRDGQIKQVSAEFLQMGYDLRQKDENKPGCFMMLFTLGWARGYTELVFVKRQ